MLLFHYATHPYNPLRTRRLQQPLSDEDIRRGEFSAKRCSDPAPYYDHISFFLEPVPLDIIGDIFKPYNHPFWHNGNRIYEHIVEHSQLPKFDYVIVETEFDRLHADKNWYDGIRDTPSAVEHYFAEAAKKKIRLGERGSNHVAFERGARAFIGGLRQAYINAPSVNDASAMLKYAASVPHVMLYPVGGTVKLLQKPRQVTIGDKPLMQVTTNIIAAPSAHW